MNRLVGFLKTTLVGGFFVILPIALIWFLLGEVYSILEKLLAPVTGSIEVETIGGIDVDVFITVAVALGLCLLAGLVIRTERGRHIMNWLEVTLLGRLPGYTLIKNLTNRFSPDADITVALAPLHPGVSALVFVAEDVDDERVAVFAPLAPTPTLGPIFIVKRSELEYLDGSMTAAVTCVTQWGIGASKLISQPGKDDPGP